jgi:DNA-binding transcriptional MerR regulator
MTLSQTPTYNLGAVLRETGLVADTLRAWERRYGVPMPQRTEGGHRLYSQRDIQLIKWLMKRQAEGLSISSAVVQWRALTATGLDPLEETRAADAAASEAQLPGHDRLKALRDQWLGACLEYDEAAAQQILNEAFAQYSVETVAAELIQGALHEIGEMWMRGQASVQQEHFLSALATRYLDALIGASPAPIRNEPILLACAESELHDLPLRYLNLLLRRRGRKVVFLGANVPTRQLAETAETMHAAVVVLSAERLASAERLRDSAARLTKNGVPVVFGGRVFAVVPELQQRMPGQYARDVRGAVDHIEHLVDRPVPVKAPEAVIKSKQAEAYRQGRAGIEIEVQHSLAGFPIPPQMLEIANSHFGTALEAALELGSISYLDADLAWARALLGNQGLPPPALPAYLRAQARALRAALGKSAAPIADWLEGYASRQQ